MPDFVWPGGNRPEVTVHVWPTAEAVLHTLEGTTCCCNPTVEQEVGAQPIVSHQQMYCSPTQWQHGRAQDGHTADYSVQGICRECGSDNMFIVETASGSAIPPNCLDRTTFECEECGEFAVEVRL